jgi:hypothetical protein
MPRSAVVRARLASAEPDAVLVEVDSPQGTKVLEYRSPAPTWQSPPRTLDFAAVALAQFAASMDADLEIAGPVTSTILERLDEYLWIWSVWRPDLFRHVPIRATDEVGEVVAADRGGAVMGFSGGVDASFSLAAHSSRLLGRLSHPVDLGVLVVGWDIRHGDSAGITKAADSARTALDAYGARTAVISTNWQQDFCAAWFMSFNAGLMGILHTFSDVCSAAIHATDHNYLDELKMPPYGSHMAINHLLGRPGFPVISSGGTHRRIERVAALADHPVLLEGLRVCYQEGASGANCGHCEKCVRTQLELRVTGIQADSAFPSPMEPADLDAAKVTNATVLMHFEDILDKMADGDELRPRLVRWVREARLAQARRRGLPLARVADLERQLKAARADLEASRAEVEAIKASRSWRATAPLRAGSDVLRGRRATRP